MQEHTRNGDTELLLFFLPALLKAAPMSMNHQSPGIPTLMGLHDSIMTWRNPWALQGTKEIDSPGSVGFPSGLFFWFLMIRAEFSSSSKRGKCSCLRVFIYFTLVSGFMSAVLLLLLLFKYCRWLTSWLAWAPPSCFHAITNIKKRLQSVMQSVKIYTWRQYIL